MGLSVLLSESLVSLLDHNDADFRERDHSMCRVYH